MNGEVTARKRYSPHMVTGLTSDTVYHIKVSNTSGESNEVSFQTMMDKPLLFDRTNQLMKWYIY